MYRAGDGVEAQTESGKVCVYLTCTPVNFGTGPSGSAALVTVKVGVAHVLRGVLGSLRSLRVRLLLLMMDVMRLNEARSVMAAPAGVFGYVCTVRGLEMSVGEAIVWVERTRGKSSIVIVVHRRWLCIE